MLGASLDVALAQLYVGVVGLVAVAVLIGVLTCWLPGVSVAVGARRLHAQPRAFGLIAIGLVVFELTSNRWRS